ISPRGLFLAAKLRLAPGKSIVVNVPPVPCAIAVLRLGAIPADRAISAASAKTRRDLFADLIRVFMGFSFLVQTDLRRSKTPLISHCVFSAPQGRSMVVLTLRSRNRKLRVKTTTGERFSCGAGSLGSRSQGAETIRLLSAAVFPGQVAQQPSL